MYSFSTISPRQLAGSLVGFAVLASARPSNLLPRFSGPIYEARSPVVHDAAAGKVEAQASRLITVVVGGAQDTFVPNLVRANVGDIVQFQFSSGNHTVTQSAQDTPCIALQATDPKAIHSGHIPYQSGQANVGTFNMPVTSSDPLFLFCATGPHCQEGQVMMVNPTNDDQLLAYAKLATTAKQTVDGTNVVGGQVASVPIGGAAFVAAPEPAGGPGGGPGGPPGAGAGAGGGAAAPPAAPPAAAPPAASASSSLAATSKSSSSKAAATSTTTTAAGAAKSSTTAAAASTTTTKPAAAAGEAAAPTATPSSSSSSSAVAEEAVASPVEAVAPVPPAAGPTEEAVAAPIPAPAPVPAPAAPAKPKGPTTTLTLFGRAPGGAGAEPTHVIYYA